MTSTIKTHILRMLKKYAINHNHDLGWFRFVTLTKTGAYRFLANKEVQWLALEDIANQASSELTGYTKGQIVDALASLVTDPQIID